MTLIYLFFLTIIFNIAVTPILLNEIEKRQITFFSKNRNQESKSTPRIGGFLIIFSLLVALLIYSLDVFLPKILGAFLIISICGILDDLLNLSWKIKFLLQFIVAALIISFLFEQATGVTFLGISLSGIPAYIFLALFIVGTMNSINMLDGLDGLLGGFTLIVSGVLIPIAFINENYFILTLVSVSAGGIIAFLRYNAYPAKIYLGDSGSLVIGFILTYSALSISMSPHYNILDLNFVFILMGIPIIDMVRLFVLRILSGSNPFMADLHHLHHKFLENKISVANTSFIVLLVSIGTSISAVLYLIYGSYFYIVITVIITLLIMLEGHYKLILIPLSRFIASSFLTVKIFSEFKRKNQKLIIFISTLAILYFLFTNLPKSSFFIEADLILLLISQICLLFVALFLLRKLDIFYHLFFFLNIILYLLIAQNHIFDGSLDFGERYKLASFFFSPVPRYGILVIAIFLFMRRLLKETMNGYLHIIDVNILYVVILSVILERFHFFNFLGVLNPIIVISFLIYLWYRSIDDLMPKFTALIYITSFVLPILSLIKLLAQ